MTPTSIKLNPDLFTGANGSAILAVFQQYVQAGILLTDIEYVKMHSMLPGRVTIGYGKQSEMKLKKSGGPSFDGSFEDRVHEAPRHEVVIPIDGGNSHLDMEFVVNKLAFLRD